MNVLNRVNYRWYLIATLVFFASVYVSISIYNHYNFRTFAYDLGIKNQAIWDYAHGRMNYNTVMPELNGKINILANHFEPVLFIIAPFYYIFGSYTLLVAQIFFILLGGYGVFKYISTISKSPYLAVLAMATFYGMWGIFAALSFDFHTNVLAAVMLPWLFYAIQLKKKWLLMATLLFILMCKENMALWMVFVGAGMFLHWWRDRSRRNMGIMLSIVSLIYFVGVMRYIMPWFANDQLPYLHFKYAALGQSWGEALQTIFTRPGYALSLLFQNHSTSVAEMNEHAKMQLHLYVLLSGGIFLLARPQFLVMLIPIYAQKMFSDDPVKWSIFQQYSIEFVPIIVLAGYTVISNWKNPTIRILAGILFFLTAFDTSKEFSGLWKPLPYGKVLTNFYQKNHYTREINRDEIQQLVKAVPADSSVSATFYILPHIANRNKIYQFPQVADATYIVACTDYAYNYPLDSIQFIPTMDSILQTGAWNIQLKTEHGYLLKRK